MTSLPQVPRPSDVAGVRSPTGTGDRSSSSQSKSDQKSNPKRLRNFKSWGSLEVNNDQQVQVSSGVCIQVQSDPVKPDAKNPHVTCIRGANELLDPTPSRPELDPSSPVVGGAQDQPGAWQV